MPKTMTRIYWDNLNGDLLTSQQEET